MKNVRNIICFMFLGVLLLTMTGWGKQISGITNADYAVVSFTIDPAAETYKFEENDVEKIISLIKPKTWRKGRLTLELSPVEYIYFNQDDTRYVVGILDVENNEVMFKVYSETNGKWNSDSCYYKTDDVGYEELMDSLKDMCINEE